MAHKINKRDIQTGLTQAWHGKTNLVEKITRENSGIVYPMSKQPLLLPNKTETEHFAIVSDDDGLPIGNPVKKGYKLITNEQMLDIIDKTIAGTSHQIVSIGSVSNREKVFASIKVSDDFIAAGRKTENTLNILWGHGGVFSVMGRSSFTVVVCANTFQMALVTGGKDFAFRMKHTGNAVLKLDNFSEALDSHYGVVAEFRAAMEEFSNTSISKVDAKRAIAGFLVEDEKLNQMQKLPTRTTNVIERVNQLFTGGPGNKGENLADLFNGFTDYYTHESSGIGSGGKDNWKQFESSEFGSANRKKMEVFDLLSDSDAFNKTLVRGDKVLQLM